MSIPPEAARQIVATGRVLDAKGWVPASAGNLSLRLGHDRIAITRSGVHKGRLGAGDVMLVDEAGQALDRALRPSAETLLHALVYRRFPEAGAVLHGHSIANTVLSRGGDGEVTLSGYELLKVFPGLPSHEASVALPVYANDQDMPRLAARIAERWQGMNDIPPGFLLGGHGVYVWGRDMEEAWLRLEGLEFLLDCELAERRIR
jgi:methylthioribulose-1-phosphate dehydratase